MNLKFSKKAWLMLGTGVLALTVVALVALRSQQTAEQNRLKEELEMVQKRLAALELDQVAAQMQHAREQIDQNTGVVVTLKNQLAAPTDSITAGERLFGLAALTGVQITELNAGDEYKADLGGVPTIAFPVSATVTGTWDGIIDYIAQLKDAFPACMVERAELYTREGAAAANLKFLIYTYKGN